MTCEVATVCIEKSEAWKVDIPSGRRVHLRGVWTVSFRKNFQSFLCALQGVETIDFSGSFASSLVVQDSTQYGKS